MSKELGEDIGVGPGQAQALSQVRAKDAAGQPLVMPIGIIRSARAYLALTEVVTKIIGYIRDLGGLPDTSQEFS